MKARAGYAFAGVALLAATSIVVFGMWDEKKHGATAVRSELQPNGAHGQDRQLAHLRAEISSLKGQLVAIRAGLDDRGAEAMQPEPTVEEPSSDQAVAPTPEEGRAQGAAEWREHMQQVSAAFVEEPVDKSWSAEKHQFVEARLRSDPVLNAVASEVECRSSTCRVELVGDPIDVNKQLPMFVHSLGQTLPRADAERIDHPDGRVTMVVYVSDHQAESEEY